jgi:hypothetical protein
VTSFENKCKILADLWMNYRDDEEFVDFCDYNDIGLPLAYFVSADLVTLNQVAEIYISETFDLLCAALGLPLNAAYDSLELMFEVSKMSDD